MYFFIQVSNPVIQSREDTQVDDMIDAIEAIFPYEAEDAYFIWWGVPIRVQYKYDVSVLIYRITALLDAMLIFKGGSYSVNLDSYAFSAVWHLKWADGRVNIAAQWNSVGFQWNSVAGAYKDLLNSRSELEMEVDMFLCEWKGLLRKILEAIDKSGIQIADKKGLDSLRRIEASISRLGILYEVSP